MKSLIYPLFVSLILVFFFAPISVHAQEETIKEEAEATPDGVERDSDIAEIQTELQPIKADPVVVPKAKSYQKSGIKNDQEFIQSTLASEDFVALQKIYLRKTGRLGITGGLVADPANPFFYSGGLTAALSYNFTETYGIEAFGFNLSATENEDLKGLRGKNAIPSNYVYPTSMMGARLLYNPWYGKVAMRNRRILPFDLLFTGGIGNIRVSQGYYTPGVQVGFGQLISLGRSLGFRWDIMYISYADDQGQAQDTYLMNITWTTFYPRETTR